MGTLLLQTMLHFHEDRRYMFRHLNNVLLHLTAGRQALWTLLPRSQVLFSPASTSLQTSWPSSKSWMTRLVNSLQRCNSAYSSGLTILASSSSTTSTAALLPSM